MQLNAPRVGAGFLVPCQRQLTLLMHMEGGMNQCTDGGLTLQLLVFVTGDMPLPGPGAPGYAEESSANRTSSAHCLELSTVPKQWHRNMPDETTLVNEHQHDRLVFHRTDIIVQRRWLYFQQTQSCGS